MVPVKSNIFFELEHDVSGLKKQNYWLVEAKCGHVGRGFYFKGKFYIRAKNARRAAQLVRRFPRVKHDYSDAILSVNPIDYKEYLEGQNKEYSRPYYNCLSKQEQWATWDDTVRDIYIENHNVEDEKVLKSTKHS